MATRKKANGKFADMELGDLMARQRVLEDQLLDLRRFALHKTRPKAHERVTESMKRLDEEIAKQRSELRQRLATTASPLPPSLLANLGALLFARETVAPLLHEDVDRETRLGEHDPWADDHINRRAAVEKELGELTDEIDIRRLETEAEELAHRRKGILERIGGGR